MKTLILGFGNQDRQDDGVAWHILVSLKNSLGLPDPETIDEYISNEQDLQLIFQLQLTPEMAEDISSFDRVCFIDAHTGSVPEEIHFENLRPTFLHSPLTHHLTPNSLLSIVQTLYAKKLDAVLISVRGYEFDFDRELSKRTQALVPQATLLVLKWLGTFMVLNG